MLLASRWLSAAVLATAATALAMSPPEALAKRPARIEFTGIPWSTSLDSTAVLLTARGYPEPKVEGQPRPPATPGHPGVVGLGKILGHTAFVEGFFDEQRRLVRVVVSIAPEIRERIYPTMRAVYEDVSKEALAKYGIRADWVERFRFPYNLDDGYEDRALRDGAADIRSVWQSLAGDRLTVEMDRACGVRLTYDSAAWPALLDRLRAKGTRDL